MHFIQVHFVKDYSNPSLFFYLSVHYLLVKVSWVKGDICRISGELFLGGLSNWAVWNVFVSPSMYAVENAFSRKIDLTAKNAWYYAKQRELSISFFFVSSPMLRSFEEKKGTFEIEEKKIHLCRGTYLFCVVESPLEISWGIWIYALSWEF